MSNKTILTYWEIDNKYYEKVLNRVTKPATCTKMLMVEDGTMIPDQIIYNSRKFSLNWDADNCFYCYVNPTDKTTRMTFVEWGKPNSPYIENLYGPAKISIDGMPIVNLRFVKDGRQTTRERLKRDYEMIHLRFATKDNPEARLLADDICESNVCFWHDWMLTFEQNRKVSHWMNAVGFRPRY